MSLLDTGRSALELDWVRRIQTGDTAAFEALFTAYYEPLLRFAFGYVKTRAAAEEVVQDVFLKFWAQRERWEVRDTVKTYLYAATRNRALNWLRRAVIERRWAASIDADADTATILPRAEYTDEAALVADLDDAIRRAIDRLPKRCREAFVLSREHHLTYEQIAEVMGTSVKTVQEQIGRALRALRASLADWLA